MPSKEWDALALQEALSSVLSRSKMEPPAEKQEASSSRVSHLQAIFTVQTTSAWM